MMFFMQQVKECVGGLRLAWAVHEWEEQANRGRTEQQCWTDYLLIRIGLKTRDPYVVPYHLHLPTACRSAINTQTPIVLSAQALSSSMFLHHYVVCTNTNVLVLHRPPTKNKNQELQSCRSEMDSKSSSSHARPRLFAFLSLRRMTLSRVSLISCSLTSLWCSKVCSASTLGSVLKWKGSHSLAKKKETLPPRLSCYRK